MRSALHRLYKTLGYIRFNLAILALALFLIVASCCACDGSAFADDYSAPHHVTVIHKVTVKKVVVKKKIIVVKPRNKTKHCYGSGKQRHCYYE